MLGERVLQVWWWYLHWFRRYRKKTRGGGLEIAPPSGARVKGLFSHRFETSEKFPSTAKMADVLRIKCTKYGSPINLLLILWWMRLYLLLPYFLIIKNVEGVELIWTLWAHCLWLLNNVEHCWCEFCEPFARFFVWSMPTNGAPTTDWFSTPLFSRLIHRGDNDLWSVLPRVFSTFDFDFPLFRTEYHPHLLN